MYGSPYNNNNNILFTKCIQMSHTHKQYKDVRIKEKIYTQ